MNSHQALAQQLSMAQSELSILKQQAREIANQAMQLDQQRATLAIWMVSLVLEHHEGVIDIDANLITHAQQNPMQFKTEVIDTGEGKKLRIAVVDMEGHEVVAPEKPSALFVPPIEQPSEPETRCSVCNRAVGHNLDCPNYTQYMSQSGTHQENQQVSKVGDAGPVEALSGTEGEEKHSFQSSAGGGGAPGEVS